MGKKEKRTTTAAEGERRALVGFIPQYRAAAWLILQTLRRSNLEFVEFTHPGAGQVDDFAIGTPLRVDAYQVKWREFPRPITFHSLIRASGETEHSLLRQLANGWQQLRTQHPERRVVVHLFTCDYPSDQDAKLAEGMVSLARFLSQAWEPWRSGDRSGSAAFQKQWDVVREETGLSPELFESFIADCELDLAAKVGPGQIVDDRDDHLVIRQIRDLAEQLKSLAINPARRHHFDRESLLHWLNWNKYFNLRNRHEFITPPVYCQIQSTADELSHAIETLSGGYLALIGPPGSGKSTLLTRFCELRAGQERWVRYYAFVPGSQEAGNTRGESENFLHDLVTMLERAGFSAGESHSEFDRQQLLTRMDRQLQLLGEDYSKTGRRWIILVDGLDHVPREQQVVRSMLHDLPVPDRVPTGVFILLGSQTVELSDLPSSVRTMLLEPPRRIQMKPLPRHAVAQIAAAWLPKATLTDAQRERIYTLSQGHPLALALLLNQINQDATEEENDRFLNQAEPYAGDIGQLYESHWSAIALDYPLVQLLALMARLRRNVDFGWLYTWADQAVLHRIRLELKHLFFQETDTRWYFFHNSFRLFVRNRTTTVAGATPESNERALHKELAGFCTASDPSSPWRWETLFHLVEASEHNPTTL